MKKSLLALAAMSAIASTTQAQSSVTVYGILEVGFVGSQYNSISATANAANVNNQAVVGGATTKQTRSGFGQSGESISCLAKVTYAICANRYLRYSGYNDGKKHLKLIPNP